MDRQQRHPLTDSSSIATISKEGNFVLINGRNQTVWSTNVTTSPINTTLRIQDNGNLVLRDVATGTSIWESFSEPLNVFVPTMLMTDNINTGKKIILSSWKTETDPGVGSITGGLEATYGAQLFVWSNGRPHWKSGPWNGQILVGVRDMYSPYLDGFSVVNDSSGTFYFTAPDQGKFLMNVEMNTSGTLVQRLWDEQKKSWDTIWTAPQNECEVYGTCGPFGSCNIRDSPICSCLRGFELADEDEWERGNWTNGCKRKTQLQCSTGGAAGDEDGFLRLRFMRVPDLAQRFPSNQVDECRRRCLGSCSCLAYAHDSYIGCMLWSDTLIDVQDFNGVGMDLFIRLPASELDNHKDKKLYIIIPVVVGRGGFGPVYKVSEKVKFEELPISEKVKFEELPLFNFKMLASATDQFHENNLLGRGGFGPVYKGNLPNRKEIAVKRLSVASRQGAREFMNEVVVISKLQHRNLVKLLGCCAEKEEKMLIYEYMPNKSLDVCLFDPTHPSQKVLDWMKRVSIIEGIGRGLLYLHKDSRLMRTRSWCRLIGCT